MENNPTRRDVLKAGAATALIFSPHISHSHPKKAEELSPWQEVEEITASLYPYIKDGIPFEAGDFVVSANPDYAGHVGFERKGIDSSLYFDDGGVPFCLDVTKEYRTRSLSSDKIRFSMGDKNFRITYDWSGKKGEKGELDYHKRKLGEIYSSVGTYRREKDWERELSQAPELTGIFPESSLFSIDDMFPVNLKPDFRVPWKIDYDAYARNIIKYSGLRKLPAALEKAVC